MKTQRRVRTFAWIAGLLLASMVAWLISGCGVASELVALVQTRTPTPTATPTSTQTPTPTPTSTPTSTFTPTATPTSTPTSTPTRVPTATFTPTPRPTNTPTAVPTPNLSAAALTLQDLPRGFEALDEADLAKLGISNAALARSFGSFSQAKLQDSFVFIATGTNRIDLIMGLLIHPLSTLERASFDFAMANPDTLFKGIASGMGGSAAQVKSTAVLPGMDKFGDKSAGVTLVFANAAAALRMDIVIIRRGPAVAVLYVMYLDGTQPTVGIAELAKKWDSRLAAALPAY